MPLRLLLRRALLACLALGLTGCPSGPGPADASSARDADVVEDAGEEPGRAPLDYQPEGCMHRVHTTVGTWGNFRGDRDTFGAAPTPRAVHVSWPGDPSSAAAFLWRTDPGTRASVVQYGTAPDALSRTAIGHVTIGGTTVNAAPVHEVHVCGLSPDTTYYYRVGGDGHWSGVQRFKTAPAPGSPDGEANFAVAGDSRDSVMVLRQVQEQMLRASGMRQPDFELFTGDAVYFGPLQPLWDAWFDGASPALARMPFVLAHGNHEGLAINYLVQFAQPQADAPEQDELFFSLDYGPVHLVVLNDTPPGGELAALTGRELTWLRADLARARANRPRVPWIVVAHHKPPFASSSHSDDVDTQFLRGAWPPVYDEFGVDVVFSGHEHNFEISRELDGAGNEVRGRRGTVYVVAGGAGAALYTAGQRAWTRHAETVENFLLVHATPRALEVTPHRGDGTVITQGRVMLTPRPM